MTEAFDPYHEWLGIPPSEQPPSHYRLLGVAVFEASANVIANAADQRMAHLRTFQSGPHAVHSQKLLNEVAAARVCLLNAQKKAAYDEQLRRELAAHRPAPPPVRHAPPARPAEPVHADDPDPVQPTRTWASPEQLGDYQLLEKLGEGGMGAVYKAVHMKLKRVVALKVLPREKVSDPKAQARFEREMQAAGAVDHPNVVRGTDAREIEGTVFLVMDYVDGLTLGEIVRWGHPMTVADACEMTRQAALGLQAAHEHGLVHRDVKPANLMLNRHGQVKLLDLGLARFEMDRPAGEELTGSGMALGTLDYIAPEQLADSHTVDIRADIYSLGCTLFKLLAGRAPFADEQGPAAQMNAHLKKPPPRIRKLRGDVPQPLAALLDRMLAKDPAKRFPAPGELADALAPFCLGANLTALLTRVEADFSLSPSAEPAERETHSVSSGLTRFLRGMGGQTPAPGTRVHEQKDVPGWAVTAGIIALAAVLLVVIGIFAIREDADNGDRRVGPGGWADQGRAATAGPPSAAPATLLPAPYLLIQWPAGERTDARLELDGKPQDLAKLASPDDRDALRLTVEPGRHKVWITRRGFQPFEQVVTLSTGKDVVIQPAWSALAADAPEVDLVAETPPAESTAAPPLAENAPPAGPPAATADLATYVEQQPGMEPSPSPSPRAGEGIASDAPTVASSNPSPPAPLPQGERGESSPSVDPAEQARREGETRYAAAVAPVEALVSAWDFEAAIEALKNITFAEPALQARRNARGRELQRLAAFKKKLIERLSAADPRPSKSSLVLKGGKGDVTGADQKGITAELAGGKSELHAWADLSAASVAKVTALAIDPQSPDDWIAAGLLAFTRGDASQAERALDKAKSLGANIDPYLATLAQASLAEAAALLEEGLASKAEEALVAFQEEYGTIPWFRENRAAFDALFASARKAVREAEAEKLYAEAVKLYEEKELFDVRAIVQQLREEYAGTRVVIDSARAPTFAELQESVGALGRLVTVRLDGKGDFESIQEAVDAVPPKSLIEIQDNGPYRGGLEIPKEKEGITIRGKQGSWPIVSSVGREGESDIAVLSVSAPGIAIQRIAVLRSPTSTLRCLSVYGGAARLRAVIVYMDDGPEGLLIAEGAQCEVKDSLVLTTVTAHGQSVFRNSLLPGPRRMAHPFSSVNLYGASELHDCTVPGACELWGSPQLVTDSVVGVICRGTLDDRLEYCDLFGKPPFNASNAKQGTGSFSADPLFRDPASLDYRLQPGSPCIGKASDGGDIGCRYTPEMIEMCQVALELAARGLIKW